MRALGIQPLSQPPGCKGHKQAQVGMKAYGCYPLFQLSHKNEPCCEGTFQEKLLRIDEDI